MLADLSPFYPSHAALTLNSCLIVALLPTPMPITHILIVLVHPHVPPITTLSTAIDPSPIHAHTTHTRFVFLDADMDSYTHAREQNRDGNNGEEKNKREEKKRRVVIYRNFIRLISLWR